MMTLTEAWVSTVSGLAPGGTGYQSVSPALVFGPWSWENYSLVSTVLIPKS